LGAVNPDYVPTLFLYTQRYPAQLRLLPDKSEKDDQVTFTAEYMYLLRKVV